MMFGVNKTIAVQDPSYPVYVDTSVMMGNSGTHNGTGFDGIEYMICTPENNFFPDLAKVGGLVFWGGGVWGEGGCVSCSAWSARPRPLLPRPGYKVGDWFWEGRLGGVGSCSA